MQTSNNSNGVLVREFFAAETEAATLAKMDLRKHELESQGHTQFTRTKIGRNAACPCGSGLKFKKCCISKVG